MNLNISGKQIPLSKSWFFVVFLALVILSRCEYIKMCIFTSVCMTHACYCCLSKSVWVFLWIWFLSFLLCFSQSKTAPPATCLCLLFAFFSNQSSNEMWGVSVSFQSALKGFCTYQLCLPPSFPPEFILPSLCLLV